MEWDRLKILGKITTMDRNKRLKKSSKYITAMAGLGLLVGTGNAVAQEAQTQEPNHVYTNQEHSMTGEGSVVKRVLHPVYLGPNSVYDLDGVFGYHAEGDLTNRVVNFESGMRNIIADLKDRGEDEATIDYFKEILEFGGENDPVSVNQLEKAVQDGIIEGSEISNIGNGLYVVVPTSQPIEGKKSMGGATILDIKYLPNYEGIQPLTHESLLAIETNPDYSETPQQTEIETTPEPQIQPPVQPQPQIHGREIEDVVVERETERVVDEGENEEIEEVDKRRVATRFSLDGTRNIGDYPSTVGGQVGIGYGPISLVLNYSDVKDENLENVVVPLSNGRQGVGSNDLVDRSSVGAGLEANLGPFIVGGGINLNNYSVKTIERIETLDGEVLRDNELSKSESELSERFYLGMDIPLNENLGLRVFGGHDTELGNFAGAGVSIKTHTHRTQHRE